MPYTSDNAMIKIAIERNQSEATEQEGLPQSYATRKFKIQVYEKVKQSVILWQKKFMLITSEHTEVRKKGRSTT